MDSQRNILLIAFVFVSFLLFQAWSTKDVEPTPQASVQQTQQDTSLPSDGNNNNSLDPLGSSEAPATTASQNLITVNTDVLTLSINPVGGDIIEAKLNQYNNTLDSKDPFILLKNQPDHTFIAQSGLVGPQGVDVSSSERPTYQVAQTEFNLADGQDSLVIPMTYTKDGIEYTKTFTLKRDNYAVDVSYDVKNNSGKTAQVGMYAHLRQNILDDGGNLAMPTYRGGAYSSEDTRYKKYSFDDMQEKGLNIQLKDGEGWAGMIQHYFASAWIPRQAPNTTIYSRTVGSNLADIGIRLPNIQVADGADGQLKATLWVGPKLQDQMAATAEHLELSVDYGWLWFIAKPLHMLLSFIHSIVGNWGFSIMMLTFIVRGAMYPLTRAQYTSMAKMRMLQPKIAAMRERLGDDRQRISQEMMEMYKKEKVNPLGGCLPIFLQMPIFIALYWSLMESVELRHAPFFGWIQDLSAQDPYYVLPLLMGVTMFFIQRMSPTTVTDPMQQKIMTFMPVMFTFFFLWFPSGLVLYWLVSNIVTLIQQTLIYKGLEKKGLHTKKS